MKNKFIETPSFSRGEDVKNSLHIVKLTKAEVRFLYFSLSVLEDDYKTHTSDCDGADSSTMSEADQNILAKIKKKLTNK